MVTQRVLIELAATDKNFVPTMQQSKKATVAYEKSLEKLATSGKKVTAAMAEKLTVLKKLSAPYRNIANAVKSTKKQLEAAADASSGMGGKMRQMRGVMLGAGLAMLFMGQAIKKTMSTILRSTIGTFNRVMQESEFFGTATQRLAVHWEFLKFVIGSTINRALEPLMPILIRMINGFAKIIQNNPNAVFATMIGLFTAGAFLAAIGQVGLFLNGISAFVVSGAFSTLMTTQLPKLASLATKGIGIGVALHYAKEAFDQFSEGNIIGGISGVLGTSAGAALYMGKIKGFAGIIIVKTALEVVKGVFDKDANAVKNSIAEGFLTVGGGVIFLNPLAGGALIAIGVALRIVSIEGLKKFFTGKAFEEDFGGGITGRKVDKEGGATVGFGPLSSTAPTSATAPSTNTNISISGGINITAPTSGPITSNDISEGIGSEIKRIGNTGGYS